MSLLEIHSDDNGYYVSGNQTWTEGNERDGQSVASRTTNNSESTTSVDITYSSPVSDDDGPSSRRSPEPAYYMDEPVFATSIDLQRSQQIYEEQDGSNDTNVFECEVDVWPDRNGRTVNSVTLLFDTQCQDSNWVAARIVDKLGVKPAPLSRSAQFIGFNGQPMTASHKITLWFKIRSGGSSRRAERAEFLVSPLKNVPFDMLLGATDCLRLRFIERPRILGLAARKWTRSEETELPERMAQQSRAVEEQARKKRKAQQKQKQEKEEKERRREEASKGNRKDSRSRSSR